MNSVKVNDLYRSKIDVIFLVVEVTTTQLTFLGPEGLDTLSLSDLEWLVKRKFWFKIEV